MQLNWKTFAFGVGIVALGVAIGKLAAEPMLMNIRGMLPSGKSTAAASTAGTSAGDASKAST